MTPDSHSRLPAMPEAPGEFERRLVHRSWDQRFKETVETPGRLSAIVGGVGGLILSVLYGLLIGGTDLQTVAILSLLLVFTFLLVVAGEFWWALLVIATACGVNTSEFGFKMSGFELGFVVVVVSYLIRVTLRAMTKFRPATGLGVPFWALFLYLIIHSALMITYHRYEDPSSIKNIMRGCYSVLAPLGFFLLLGHYCNPRTVKPVTLAFLIVTSLITIVAIPIWLFGIDLDRRMELPFSLMWLSPLGAAGMLKSGAVLANFGIAFLLTARTTPRRWLMLGLIGLAFVGSAASGGRLAFASVFLVVALYLALKRQWNACAACAAGLVLLILISTKSPEFVSSLPITAQRALSPLNLGDSDIKRRDETSNQWHRELREDSFDYWTESWVTFLFGHGYGGWDYSLSGDENWNRDFEYAKKIAVQMGHTENAFSSITNIFGLTGLLLYGWFGCTVFRETWRARKLAQRRSFEEAMCDVSLVYMTSFTLLLPFAGGAPGSELLYWQLGLLAARPLLGKAENKELIGAPKPRPLARAGPVVFNPRAGQPALARRHPIQSGRDTRRM